MYISYYKTHCVKLEKKERKKKSCSISWKCSQNKKDFLPCNEYYDHQYYLKYRKHETLKYCVSKNTQTAADKLLDKCIFM